MKGRIQICNRQHAVSIRTAALRHLTRCLLQDIMAIGPFDLGICLVDALEMASINRRFLAHEGPTDVITFDYGPKSRVAGALQHARSNPSGRATTAACGNRAPVALCGEIFVCTDEALLQARRYRTHWRDEVARYIIHGVLHLRGYDDQRAADRRKMKREEDRLLKRLSAGFPLSKLNAEQRPEPDRRSAGRRARP